MPKVSVLMPTYNNARYLPDSLGSILQQSFRDFEFIIVDDGSTDETPQILARYAHEDPRIRLVRNERNCGRGAARNRALGAQPVGDFFAIMDSDDISFPARLERQVAFLEAHPETVAVGAQARNVDEWNRPTPEQTRLPETHGSLAWTLLFSVPFCNPTVMMRREAVRMLDGYQEGSAVEDAEFWTRIVRTGRLANLPDVLLLYRMPSERLARRMADWDAPLREVSRLFMQEVAGTPVSSASAFNIHASIFHNPALCLDTDAALSAILLLQSICRAMRANGMLRASDEDEVAGILIGQFRMLLSYCLGGEGCT